MLTLTEHSWGCLTYCMALRVLLADESSTIKKVMQLALQDFGVEVKSVPIGLDVLQVSRSFHPDIIFADVLLSKRTGYDVAVDVKGDPGLRSIPVVLMWSSFMDLDEARARSCGAERRLEKPFDADHLRQLVKDLVPRLSENQISNYLTFPDLPHIMETPQEDATPTPVAQAPAGRSPAMSPPPNRAPAPQHSVPAPPPQAMRGPSMQSPPTKPAAPPMIPKKLTPELSLEPEFQKPKPRQAPPKRPQNQDTSYAGVVPLNSDLEDPDDFQQIPLPGARTKNIFEHRDEEEWRQGGLEQFRVTPNSPEDAPDDFVDLTNASMAMTDGVENVGIDDLENLTSPTFAEPPTAPPRSSQSRTFNTGNMRHTSPSNSVSSMGLNGLDPMRAEEVLREQVREVLENVAWKIIPDIVERIVREEIQKLMKEAERLS